MKHCNDITRNGRVKGSQKLPGATDLLAGARCWLQPLAALPFRSACVCPIVHFLCRSGVCHE